MTCSVQGDHKRTYKSRMTFPYDSYEQWQRAVCSHMLHIERNCRRCLVEIRPIHVNVSLVPPIINFQI